MTTYIGGFFDTLPIKILKKDFNCLKGMEFI